MKRVIVRAPVRADLAGGTLDLWPLYLFHPGSRTVNVAISYHAESEISTLSNGGFEVELTDQQYRQRYESLAELAADPKVSLLHRALEHFHLTGVRIVTRTDAPRGSGLGGSSALTVTLVRGLSELAGQPIEGDALITLVRDLETRLLGVPAGVQDYYPPVYGGLASLHLEPGALVRKPIPISVSDLSDHMLLHYSGIAHFSGTNNWELYKRQIDGNREVHDGLENIARTSLEMERALDAADFEAAGAALAAEWRYRKELIEGISTPELEASIAAAHGAGAWGGKVCGAGGGGCLVFLMPADKRDDVARALAQTPGRLVEASPVAYGLTIEVTEEGQPAAPARSRITPRRTTQSLDQLYVHGRDGEYRPFLLAEAVVTHHESRSGVHRSVVRSYVAPIEPSDGRVQWHRAEQVDLDRLDLRAVPEPRHRTVSTATPEALMQSAIQAEESFRQYLEETQKLHIFHNPAFGLYSEPSETRATFIERCLEEAKRRVEDQQERLEGTFRRRIDQLRERSEREQREIDNDEVSREEAVGAQDVNVAWGQALYNITSGRKSKPSDAPHSIRENDYIENIAQIQRAWDRELDSLRDDLTSKARAIEESAVVPSEKSIEVTKYLILWSPTMPSQP
jgi:D-glycero-alpha-D-manno-heptose-7-phosphate kinase